MSSDIRYVRNGGVAIAYQVVGDGLIDTVFVDQWFSNVDAQWRLPPLARFLERLAAFGRVIVLDKRGTGLSDPVPLGRLPTLEEWMDDIRKNAKVEFKDQKYLDEKEPAALPPGAK